MSIKHRAAQIDMDGSSTPMTAIEPQDSALPPDITYPAAAAAPTNIQGHFPPVTVGATTADSGAGLLTETEPLSTSIPTSQPSSTPTPKPITVSVTSSATPTPTPAASKGMSPGQLTAAIVVPIAILAILIPILTYWFLSHRRKLREQKHTSQRSSRSREPMVQRQASHKEPPSYAPQRMPSHRRSRENGVREPPSAHVRNSLGLFNFELSPTTPTSPLGPGEADSSPRFSFSVARALEMRRSQPSIVQPHARTSDARVSRSEAAQPHNSRSDVSSPPPPYTTQRPLESAATTSHFAPLSRIGTQRSPPVTTSPTHDSPGSGRSNETSSAVTSLPHMHSVVTRKPLPNQPLGSSSKSPSPQNVSHLDGPFSSYLPERSSGDAFSIDTSQWEDRPRQDSTVSSIQSHMDHDERSTVHPHDMV
ncbi:hypothetical protein ACLMJK_002398 [Lecanora helva]